MTLINGYCPITAEELLGSVNYGYPHSDMGCLDRLSNLIYDIWITVRRVFNYLFGDGLWYNNQKAAELITYYCLDQYRDVNAAGCIERIYQKLHFRAEAANNDRPVCSYATTLRPIYEHYYNNLNNSQPPPEYDLYDNVGQDSFDQKFVTGNITVKEAVEQMQTEGLLHNEAEIRSVIPGIEASLRDYKVELRDSNNIFLAEALAPRKYQGISYGSIPSEKNPEFAWAKDPYDLFGLAFRKACDALDIDVSQLNQDFLITPQMMMACQLAIIDLISQASLKEDCIGPYLEFNDFLTARYQKPLIVYKMEDGVATPTVVFKIDILSSTYVGCDPEGAKRLLSSLEESQCLEHFKKYLFNQSEDFKDERFPILKALIQLMASQIKERYGSKIISLNAQNLLGTSCLSFSNNENCSFEDLIRNAQTPHQLIKQGLLWAAQSFATRGLINQDDLTEATIASSAAQKLICTTAAFQIIKNALVIDNFAIRLNPYVILDCGKFYTYLLSDENPYLLESTTRYIANALGGDGSEYDPASHPIEACGLFSQLSEQEILFSEVYFNAYSLVQIYQVKNIHDPQMLGLDQQLRSQFAQMPPERQYLIAELRNEICKIATYLADQYYGGALTAFNELVHFNDDALPTPIVYNDLISGTFYQPVQEQYLPFNLVSEVTIKRRVIFQSQILAHQKLDRKTLSKSLLEAILKQNIIIQNLARCGNCMFGALALEIFGENVGHKIEEYCGYLRDIASQFMLYNPDIFLKAMTKPRDVVDLQESEKAFMNRMGSILYARLQKYCERLKDRENLQWGTALELEAIAAVFGIPIHIFDIRPQATLSLDSRGFLQPNSIAGSKFAGAPVRLMYTGIHYSPIRQKNR